MDRSKFERALGLNLQSIDMRIMRAKDERLKRYVHMAWSWMTDVVTSQHMSLNIKPRWKTRGKVLPAWQGLKRESGATPFLRIDERSYCSTVACSVTWAGRRRCIERRLEDCTGTRGPLEWLEHYFRVTQVPPEDQASICAAYLSGDAKLWWRTLTFPLLSNRE